MPLAVPCTQLCAHQGGSATSVVLLCPLSRSSTWECMACEGSDSQGNQQCNNRPGTRCNIVSPQPALRFAKGIWKRRASIGHFGTPPSVCTQCALQYCRLWNALYVYRQLPERFIFLCLISFCQRLSAAILGSARRPHHAAPGFLYVFIACGTWLTTIHAVHQSQNKAPRPLQTCVFTYSVLINLTGAFC